MQNLKARYILLIILLILSASVSSILSSQNTPDDQSGLDAISGIPLAMDPWLGEDVLLEDWVYDLLETRAIIHRAYINQSDNVFLSVVYYADTKVDFHTPEACLGSQGLELDKSAVALSLANGQRLEVNELIYERGPDKELVYYFYKSGSYIGRSYLRLRFNIATNKLTSRSRSGALVRVSTRIPGNAPESAKQNLTDFITALYPYMQKTL